MWLHIAHKKHQMECKHLQLSLSNLPVELKKYLEKTKMLITDALYAIIAKTPDWKRLLSVRIQYSHPSINYYDILSVIANNNLYFSLEYLVSIGLESQKFSEYYDIDPYPGSFN